MEQPRTRQQRASRPDVGYPGSRQFRHLKGFPAKVGFARQLSDLFDARASWLAWSTAQACRSYS
jgi:hypothetical protein